MSNNSTLWDVVGSADASYCERLAHLVIYSLLGGVICLFGTTGNVVSLIVLHWDRESPVASLQLQVLAVIDSFFLVFWFIHFSVTSVLNHFRVVQPYYGSWIYTRVYTYPLVFVGQMAAVWMLVTIAATRCIAICSPFRASRLLRMRRTKLNICSVTVLSVLYNMPRFFHYHVVVHESAHGTNGTLYVPRWTFLMNNATYELLYLNISYCIFSFLLPLVILAVLNVKLVKAYRVTQRQRESLGLTPLSSPTEPQQGVARNLTLLTIVVVLVFILCHLPARLVQLIWKYHPQACPSAQFFITELSNLLEVLNCSTNFIIYCACRKSFRDLVRRCMRIQVNDPTRE